MSKIISVHGSDDYMLLIDFEDGSSITFNMNKLVKTIPYCRLNDPKSFRTVKFEEKSVYWNAVDDKPKYLPLKLSVDTILFSLRD